MRMITPSRLAELRKSSDRLLVLDVRSPEEFLRERIPGSTNAPLETVESHARILGSFDEIVLVCRSGTRADLAGRRLATLGAEQVLVLEGGLAAWAAAGLPVTRAPSSLPVMRQVQIIAGTLVVLGVALGFVVSVAFLGIAAVVGGGLVLAGVTGWCGMARLLGRMPWNVRPEGKSGCCPV